MPRNKLPMTASLESGNEGWQDAEGMKEPGGTFSGSVKRTTSFLEASNPMSQQFAKDAKQHASSAPLNLSPRAHVSMKVDKARSAAAEVAEGDAGVDLDSYYQSRIRASRKERTCAYLFVALASLLLLATAAKVFLPGLFDDRAAAERPKSTNEESTNDADTLSSTSAHRNDYEEKALSGTKGWEEDLAAAADIGVQDKVAVLASLIQKQQQMIQAQNKTIQVLSSELQQEKNTKDEPGPIGPKGADGKCVGVLGGNKIWVGGKPQTTNKCGGGWFECTYRKSPESPVSYRAPPDVNAKVGDTLAFGHMGTSTAYDVWKLPSRAAYDACDNTNATRLATGQHHVRKGSGRDEFELVLAPQDAGTLYFAALSSQNGKYCKERMIKAIVHVDNLQEVVVASSSSGDLAKNSHTVQHLEGVVGALARLNVLQQVQTEQRIRSEGGSGLTRIRGYETSTKAYNDASYSRYAIMNIHNHGDYRNTIGMGELQAVLNGVEFQTRHNDYSFKKHKGSKERPAPDSTYKDLEEVPKPGVPPEVLRQPDVQSQIAEMREWFRAWKAQDWTVRDYRQYFKPSLCVLEGTWITENADLVDAFASERHQIDAKTWSQLHDKIRYLFNSGRKHNLENLAYLPQAIRRMALDAANNSVPELANWEYRIFCQPVKADIPVQRFRVAQDLAPQLFKRPTTKAELFWERRARFEVNPSTFQNSAEKAMDMPRYPKTPAEKLPWSEGQTAWNYLDWLMEQVPGKDGYGANYTDEWDASIATHYLREDQPLNVGYYSRYYNVNVKDAMGLNRRRRGFNDGFLWAAKTEKFARVSKLAAWDEKAQKNQESAWSYAIPLEIVWGTPLYNWNPYGLKDAARCYTNPFDQGVEAKATMPATDMPGGDYSATLMPAATFDQGAAACSSSCRSSSSGSGGACVAWTYVQRTSVADGCVEGGNDNEACGAWCHLKSSVPCPKFPNATWDLVYSTGSFGTSDVGSAAFLQKLRSSPHPIIKRECPGCVVATHREVYYRRLTDADAADATPYYNPYTQMKVACTDCTSSQLNREFELYSTYEDTMRRVNGWGYCPKSSSLGFPGGCGPSEYTKQQWNAHTDTGSPPPPQTDVAFYIMRSVPATTCGVVTPTTLTTCGKDGEPVGGYADNLPAGCSRSYGGIQKPKKRPDGTTNNVSPAYTVEQLVQGKHEVAAGTLPKLRDGKPVKNPATGDLECRADTAYAAMTEYKYSYMTPASFYGSGDGAVVDPADTSSAATCVLDPGGVPRQVRAAGTWIVLPSIQGVGKLRTRYPIVPLHVHGNTAWKELKALEDLVLPDNYEAPTGESQLFGDARDSVYGFDMTLDGGGHSHNMKVGASTVRDWDAQLELGNADIEVTLESELRNGHEHIVSVRRNRTHAAEPWKYFLLECKFKGSPNWDQGGICADGHTLVSRISYVAS